MPADAPSTRRWRWSWTPFSILGMPLRIHASVLFVAFTLRAYVTAPLAWATWLVMIAMHELGHGILVRRAGGRVNELIVHGLGGECGYEGVRSEESVERIAWGGVLGQLALLATTALLVAMGVAVPPEVRAVAIHLNAWLIVVNLVPIEPLDGAKAWALLGRWWRRARQRRVERARQAERDETRAIQRESEQARVEKKTAALHETDALPHTRDADEVIAKVLRIPIEKREE
jgi:stage IV sporulation protein FB